MRAEISIGQALLRATRALAASGSATPRLDAELLLGCVLSCDRAALHGRWDEPLEAQAAARYAALVQRRAAHEPVAYLLGERSFYDVELAVDRRVLIPRPETEHLLEEALAWCRGREGRASTACAAQRVLRIVDVGTGSGALALVLARHLPRAQVWAVDLSPEALHVAQRNLRRYGLCERVTLLCGDLLSALAGEWDLIVANLPYIPRGSLASLPPDVRDHEPRLALDGGEDGLDLIRRFLPQAAQRLAVPGLLLLEIDHPQSQAVVALAQAHLPGAEISIVRDYAGLERVVKVKRDT